MKYELTLSGLHTERQKILPVIYHTVQLDAGYRIDLLVENKVILEIKAVEEIVPVHKAQLMTYLKLTGLKLALLLNFNVSDMRKAFRESSFNLADNRQIDSSNHICVNPSNLW